MNITEYILNDFNPLDINSTIESAKKLCNELLISHIPIVENGKLIGCFSQSDIQTIEDPTLKIDQYLELLIQFNSTPSTTTLELFSVFATYDSNIIPVTIENNYIGYYELSDILDVFSSSPFLATQGSIVLVQKNKREFTMSEISQIIESNNGTLLGAYQSEIKDDTVIITLKITSQEVNEIIQTFRRYNYTIISNHSEDIYMEELKDRAAYLQKYLNT